MIAFAPLLGAGEGVLVAIIVVVAVIAEVIAKWQEFQAAPKKANRARRAAPPGEPGAEDAPLADEIGEFLRRAAKHRGQAGHGPARGTRRPEPPVAVLVEEPAEPVLLDEPDGGVARHVQEHLKSRFKHLNPELGKEVAEADEKLDSHMQKVFGHQLGRLGSLSGETAKPTTADASGAPSRGAAVPLAQAVAGMFANPATVSQAILLHEILRRPEERWQS